MSPFWTISLFWIAVTVGIAVALAFVLPPLLRTRVGPGKAARRDINIAVYRDQLKEMEADLANGLLSDAQFESGKLELEARLADDALGREDIPASNRGGSRTLGYSLAAVLPVAALGLYAWLGQPASLTAIAVSPATSAQPGMTGDTGEQDFTKLIQQVEDKARAQPEDGEAWALLARSYAFVERWPEAVKAYETAMRLLPQDASLLSGYAEAVAITNNRVLTPQTMERVQQALDIDPNDQKGLELAAIHAYQSGNFAEAGQYFKRLHALQPPDSDYAQEVLAAQQEAERLAGAGTAVGIPAVRAPVAGAPAETSEPATIQGRIDISPALKSRLAKTDVLFLFARSGAGGPPIAAIRATAGQLPLEFALDDSSAITPGNALSQHKQVTLVARVSRSGQPTARSGDLEGQVADVAVGTQGVTLVIERVLP